MAEKSRRVSEIFRLKELRKDCGITQAQFAAMVGVQQNTVSQWETGDRNPPSTVLPRLVEVLGCTIDEIYKRNNEGGVNQDGEEPLSEVSIGCIGADV